MKTSFFAFQTFLLSFFLIITISFLSGCSSSKELTSDWSKSQIKIDGDASDWSNGLKYLKDDNIAVGFRNDGGDLYFCLTTSDLSKVRQMFRGGLTLWIEPENGGKVFGIKYPFFDMANMRNNFNRSGMESPNPERGNQGRFINRMLKNQNQIQIVNEDKRVLTEMPLENKNGIEAALGYHNDQFVYELEVPIRSGEKFPYEIDAVTGEKINVKIETGEIKRPNFERGRREREGGEGFGMGGRRGGGMRPGGMQGNENPPEPIDVSIELTLAAAS